MGALSQADRRETISGGGKPPRRRRAAEDPGVDYACGRLGRSIPLLAMRFQPGDRVRGHAMRRPPLFADEKKILDVTRLQCSGIGRQKPRSQERAGAQAAIGAVWNRLGWTMRGLDELERLAKQR